MQFELVRSLLQHAAIQPEEGPALRQEAAARLARTERAYLDPSRGGVSQLPRRFLHPTYKGNRWKDGSHEAMAYCVSARLLARPPEDGPTPLAEVLAP